jgi:hypothetical protein
MSFNYAVGLTVSAVGKGFPAAPPHMHAAPRFYS